MLPSPVSKFLSTSHVGGDVRAADADSFSSKGGKADKQTVNQSALSQRVPNLLYVATKLTNLRADDDSRKRARESVDQEAIVDTGASMSCMAKSVADLLQLEIQPTEQEICTVSGEVVVPCGITETVLVQVGSSRVLVKFLVLEDSSSGCALLLANDWGFGARAIIAWQHSRDPARVAPKRDPALIIPVPAQIIRDEVKQPEDIVTGNGHPPVHPRFACTKRRAARNRPRGRCISDTNCYRNKFGIRNSVLRGFRSRPRDAELTCFDDAREKPFEQHILERPFDLMLDHARCTSAMQTLCRFELWQFQDARGLSASKLAIILAPADLFSIFDLPSCHLKKRGSPARRTNMTICCGYETTQN